MKTKMFYLLIGLALNVLMPLQLMAESRWYEDIIEMNVGETKTVKVDAEMQYYLSKFTVKSYRWTPQDNSITIGNKSLTQCDITANKESETVLEYSVTFQSGSETWESSLQFAIQINGEIKVTKITVSPSSAQMNVHKTLQLSKEVYPNNATNKSVSWSTNNSSVATVSSNGLVTGISTGKATITCKANDGSGVYGTCNVTVLSSDIIKVTDISLNYTTLSLIKGNTQQLRSTLMPSNATDKTVKWTSSNNNVATVSDGLVTAVGRGFATITCKANDGSGVQATCDVSISTVNNYSSFTAKTIEGIDMAFYVSRVSDGVCRVQGNAIDINTTGKITIPSEVEGLKVTEIYYHAFEKCTGITEVIIPNSVETIGGYAFSGCSALAKVSLGNGVKSLGYNVFSGCFSLTTITGINQLESIGSNAFGSSYNGYIPWYEKLPDGELYLGKVLYKYKGTMPDNTTINIKEGTVQIGYEAFSNCKGLVSVTIPQSVTSISSYVFEYCPNLGSITVASGNPKYDSRNNCNAIVETAKNLIVAGCTKSSFPNSITAIGNCAFYGSGLISVVIPNNIDSIASSAFSSSSSLTSIIIGKGTRKIMDNAFSSCSKLQSIEIATANSYYDSRGNCNAIIEKGTDRLILGCPTTVIPSSVKVIGKNAFYGYGSGGLYSVTLPDNIESIEDYAFEYNYDMRSLILGKSIKKIGKSAFYGNSRLRMVRSLANEPGDLDETAFNYYSENPDSIYNSATLYVPIGSKVNYMTSLGWNKFKKIVEIADNAIPEGTIFKAKTIEGAELTFSVTDANNKTCELIASPKDLSEKVTLPANPAGFKLTSIGDNAFYYYDDERHITEIVIPEGVTNIGNNALYSRHKTLGKISLPSTITTIGDYAFEACTITSITISKAVEKIGFGIFYNCDELKSITVEEGNSVFESPNGCNAIIEKATKTLVAGCKTTKIPKDVEVIGRSALSGISDLKSVDLPESLREIRRSAFSGCGFTSVTIPANVSVIEPYAFVSCRSLKTFISLINEPFDVDSLAFSIWNADEQKYYFTEATLYVPIGTKAKYQALGGWKYFNNIVEGEINPTLNGDVNEDGSVNGTDLVALTNIILSKSPEKASADVNGDGQVNGTDYVALVNIILGKNNSRAVTRAAGATSLSIEDFTIQAGETKEMVIDLANPDDEITLVQFDLRLPDGLSIKMVDGDYDFDIAGRTTWRKHSLDANAQADGSIRFLLSSSSNTVLSGTEGAIIKLTLMANNSFTKGDIQLENILMVTPDEKQKTQSTYVYHIGMDEPVTDGIELAIEPFHIQAGETKEMVIDLTNPDDEITLVQFDLYLPTGLSIKKVDGDYDFDIAGRTTWRKHSLDANAQTDGSIRFLLSSSSNTVLSGTEGAIIKLALVADASFNGGTLKLENILLVTPDEKEISHQAIEFVIPLPAEKGTLENPFNASEAMIEAGKLDIDETGTEYYYVKGIISEIKHPFKEEFGTAMFYISEDGTTTGQFYVYGSYYLENTPWVSSFPQINVGDVVIVYGKLANYKGTLEMANKENYIYSHNGITTGITYVSTDTDNSPIYSLSGQHLAAPKKGINIVGGKKVVVK